MLGFDVDIFKLTASAESINREIYVLIFPKLQFHSNFLNIKIFVN